MSEDERREKGEALAGAVGSFVVRLRPAAEGRWQGHITHVQSGQAAYFKDVGEMLGFIGDRLTPIEGGPCERAQVDRENMGAS